MVKQTPEDQKSCSCSTTDKPPSTFSISEKAAGSVETTLNVAGMDCADEVEALLRVLRPLGSIREIKVNLMAGRVTVAHGRALSPETLISTIAQAGLRASLPETHSEPGIASKSAQRHRLVSLALSGMLAGAGILVSVLGFRSIADFRKQRDYWRRRD